MTPEDLRLIAAYWEAKEAIGEEVEALYLKAGLQKDQIFGLTLDEMLMVLIDRAHRYELLEAIQPREYAQEPQESQKPQKSLEEEI